jgi:hypothetical protein
MAWAVLSIRRALAPTEGLGDEIFWLAIEASAGALVYVATVLVAWWLSGRPSGAEATVLRALRSRLSRRIDVAPEGQRPGAEGP